MKESAFQHGPLAPVVLLIALVAAPGCRLLPKVEQPPTPIARAAATSTPTQQPIPSTTPTIRPNPTSAPTTSATSVPSFGDFSAAVRLVSHRVRPAVVQITNQQVQFDQLNRPFTIPAGVGSGVIFDTQGNILTNNHVVEGAKQLLVTLPDGRSFAGTLVGRDPQTDLAVVRISGSNLPVAPLGDSRQLQVGDWVVAIGNALALPGGPTVTVGVVSALGRSIQEPGSSPASQGPILFDLIQTSAPINPGNSGGPLLNLAGEVVGINTVVAGQAEPGISSQGIGFAIASASAKPVAEQLIRTGRVVRPFLGVSYVALTPAIAAQLGTQLRDGTAVVRVVSGSPAATAGLQPQDIITAFDGTPLVGDSALSKALNAHQPGDTVVLTVVRRDQILSLRVTLGEAPSP